MVKIAFLFPGQGSQAVGMAKDFYEKSARVREMFQTADSVLGYSLTKIVLEGPEAELKATQNTQPAIFLASMAALTRFQEEGGPEAQWSAGHSLGEYSALASAKAFDFETGLRSVTARGRFIQEACEKNPGTMAAVLGVEREKLLGLCAQASTGGELCQAVNFNAPGQIVVAGTAIGVETLVKLVKEAGAKAIPLNVSGPFHTSLLAQAAKSMDAYLKNCVVSNPARPIVSNCDARFTTEAAAVREKLTRQIDHPVLWEDSIRRLIQEGATHFIELGPGRVLSGLMKRIDPSKTALNVEDEKSLVKTLESLKGVAHETQR